MLLRAGYAFVSVILLVHWSMLSQYMVDVPYADDWRLLTPGPHLLPRQLDLAWIFLPSNSTVYATSKLFDYLYFTYTAGSYTFYQQITSALVLGGCLVAVARLLSRMALPLPWHLLGVLASAYLLQARSYWGISALGYQQALPVLGLLWVLVLVTSPRWSAWRGLALGAVVIASGLAYVSGAAAMSAAGAFLVVAALVVPSPGALGRAAIVLACALVTVAVQLGVSDATAERKFLASPAQWQYWHFAVHQVARALGDLSSDASAWIRSALATLVVLGVTGAAVVRSALDARSRGRACPPFALVAGATLAFVVAYLAVVSYGRGNFPFGYRFPADHAAAAKARFHYWWVAALLPWFAISLHRLVPERFGGAKSVPRWRSWVLPVLVAAGLLAVQSRPMWDFEGYYERQFDTRMRGLKCALQGYRTGGPIRCKALVWRKPEDLRPQLDVARERALRFADLLEPPRGRARRPAAGRAGS